MLRQKLKSALRQLADQSSVHVELDDGADPSALIHTAHDAGLDEAAVLRAASESMGVDVAVDLVGRAPCAAFIEKVPIGFARQHSILGLDGRNGYLPIAVSNLTNRQALENVGRLLGMPVRPVLVVGPSARNNGRGATELGEPVRSSAEACIQTAINAAYEQRTGQADEMIETLDPKEAAQLRQITTREDLLDVAGRAPVIKLVNLVLFEAVKQQASDVHIQPYEDALVVRMRIDGMLDDCFRLPKRLQDEVISRIKVMGHMNIAEKRLAQDGRATVQLGDRLVDLRLATLPTSYGERVVMRLLDKTSQLRTHTELGMAPDIQRRFKQLISTEHGIILVTGPTGSGKTTTLYAALQEIDSKQRNVLTLEDPIEYQLPGISQTPISQKKGMTFASGLRSVLRQDPDIIMVGEIRDHETAVMAVQSALTGHLVFSTLHTNDAASAITRLLDLDIEPYLVASSVVGVLAQRLVRKVCRNCGQRYAPADHELAQLGIDRSQIPEGGLVRGQGCPCCRQTGYSGRVGVFELLIIDQPIRKAISRKATAADIKDAAVRAGMTTLAQDGAAKVLACITTIDEVQRVALRTSV